MEVIPAIDLRGGRVVRLYQGDFQKEKVYSDDSLRVALAWQEAGVPRIHIVDLDGAKTGSPANLGMLSNIAAHVDVPLQVGGGIRSLEMAQQVMGMGVERIILGTAAASNPELVTEVSRTFGREAVVVGVDARDGRVAVQGWSESTTIPVRKLMEEMAALGVGRFIYTDIDRDGTLRGPNIQAIVALVNAIGLPILASGGIASLDDLERLGQTGVEGVIVGSALYQGAIDISMAVQRFGGDDVKQWRSLR